MTHIPDSQLQEILALAGKASPAPWISDDAEFIHGANDAAVCDVFWGDNPNNDAPFIVAACNAVPDLVREILRYRSKLPATADGVPVLEGDDVFTIYIDPRTGKRDMIEHRRVMKYSGDGDTWRLWFGVSDWADSSTCYSTREAAEAGKERP